MHPFSGSTDGLIDNRPLGRPWICSQSGGQNNKIFYMRIYLNSQKRRLAAFPWCTSSLLWEIEEGESRELMCVNQAYLSSFWVWASVRYTHTGLFVSLKEIITKLKTKQNSQPIPTNQPSEQIWNKQIIIIRQESPPECKVWTTITTTTSISVNVVILLNVVEKMI